MKQNRISFGQLKKVFLTLAILASVVALAFLGSIIVRKGFLSRQLNGEVLSEYAGIWSLSDGTQTSNVTLPYEEKTNQPAFIITTTIQSKYVETFGDTVMFYNNRNGVTVKLNNEIIYSTNNDELYKSVQASGAIIFSLPLNVEKSDLSIIFSNYEDGTCQVPTIYTGSRYAVTARLVADNLFALVIMVVLGVIGVGLIAVAIFFSVRKVKDPRIGSLAAFIMICAAWAFCDSTISALTQIGPEFMTAIAIELVMMIPIPLIFFMNYTCGNRHSAYTYLLIAVILNIITQNILAFLGVASLTQLLVVTHLIVFAATIVGLVTSFQELKVGTDPMAIKYSIGSMILLIVAICIGGFLYWSKSSIPYTVVILGAFCVVILVFLAIIVMTYLNKLQDHRLEKAKITVLEDLAMKDKMTDLYNRRAFENRLQEYDDNPHDHPDATLVILDLNGLKRINDDFGHAIGDEAIVSVANALHSVYSLHGDSFRIGGDEFAIIITDLTVDVKMLNQHFDHFIDNINRTANIKISVAKGYCGLYDGMGRRYNTVEWKQNADLSMYADKKLASAGDDIKRAEDLQSILDCVIGLVEAKDQYTANHSERVRELSVLFAGWMNLSKSTIEQIDMAAHLHDIGKVGIPEHILLKPGRLTDEEFAVMKKHPVIGAKVIERAKNMTEVSAIVLHHHERYDGKGYPEGIAKDDIPIGARIVAVADSIDAMTSKRCYRDSLGLDVCREEVERNLGKMYDPAIGHIVLEHWNEVAEIVQRG